mmetsp:Transcript_12536/g.27028  ORF Transcript_12536/g.27028 Transcript_12536/m.27028 type:complete len:259 (-) Transcript_12536:89-865(-)
MHSEGFHKFIQTRTHSPNVTLADLAQFERGIVQIVIQDSRVSLRRRAAPDGQHRTAQKVGCALHAPAGPSLPLSNALAHDLPRPWEHRRHQLLRAPAARLLERLHHPTQSLDAHLELLRVARAWGVSRVDLLEEVGLEAMSVVRRDLQVIKVGRRAGHAERRPPAQFLGRLLLPDSSPRGTRLRRPQPLPGRGLGERQRRRSEVALVPVAEQTLPRLDEGGTQFCAARQDLEEHPAQDVDTHVRRRRGRASVTRGERA